MKERALKRSEEDDVRELKGLIIKKFSEADIKGFESREQLLKALGKQSKSKISEFKEGAMAEEEPVKALALDERTFLAYKKNQFKLLEKLLTSTYFLQNINPDEYIAHDQLITTGNNSFGKENSGINTHRSYSVMNPNHQSGFVRREKKAQVIKLSRYIRNDLTNMRGESINIEKYLSETKKDDYHSIGIEELEKLIKAKSDKTYYDPKMIEDKYTEVKEFLVELNKRGPLKVEELNNVEMNKLLDACSFCMNGVHYLQKFKKSKNLIHPIDLLFVLEKMKQ